METVGGQVYRVLLVIDTGFCRLTLLSRQAPTPTLVVGICRFFRDVKEGSSDMTPSNLTKECQEEELLKLSQSSRQITSFVCSMQDRAWLASGAAVFSSINSLSLICFTIVNNTCTTSFHCICPGALCSRAPSLHTQH